MSHDLMVCFWFIADTMPLFAKYKLVGNYALKLTWDLFYQNYINVMCCQIHFPNSIKKLLCMSASNLKTFPTTQSVMSITK